MQTWLGQTYPGSLTRKPTYKECEWCGESFYRASKAVRFCGMQCAAEWRGVNHRKLVDINCEECGEIFTPPKSTSRFCTQSCRAIWTNKNRKVAPKVKKNSSYLRKADRGGLTKQEFALYSELGSEWHPQYWMSPFGALGDDIVNFKLDFANLDKKIDVEIDGRSHMYSGDRDERRDEWLKNQGWTVLRFTNQEVTDSLNSVMEKIRQHSMI